MYFSRFSQALVTLLCYLEHIFYDLENAKANVINPHMFNSNLLDILP